MWWMLSVALADEEFRRPQPEDPHYDLEVAYHEGRYEEGLAKARAAMGAHPDDADLYWMTVRFMYQMGEAKHDMPQKEKLAWYQEMVRVARKGLEVRPNDPHIEFALGISLGRLGTTKGVLSSLKMAQEIERVWTHAANSDLRYSSIGQEEIVPCHTMLSLGVFYRLVPDSGIVQLLAGTRGDIDKSIASIERAKKCAPGQVGILKELGAAYACKSQLTKDPSWYDKAVVAWNEALIAPDTRPTDGIDRQHVNMLRQDPKLACGYSRDKQQDQDVSKLQK